MKILFNFMIHFLVYNKKSRIAKFLLSVVVPIPPLWLCLSWNWCVNRVKLKQLSLIWRSGLVCELDIWNCSFCYGTRISQEFLVQIMHMYLWQLNCYIIFSCACIFCCLWNFNLNNFLSLSLRWWFAWMHFFISHEDILWVRHAISVLGGQDVIVDYEVVIIICR